MVEYSEAVEITVDKIFEDLAKRRGFSHLIEEIRDDCPEAWDEIMEECRTTVGTAMRNWASGRASRIKRAHFFEVDM